MSARQMQIYLVRKSQIICFMIFHPCLDNFVQSEEFYLVQRFLFSVENFIQRSEFRDFDPVQKLLPAVETLIQCRDFYAVQRPLSSVEIFIQSTDFYPVQIVLSSVETFIQCRDFYPIQAFIQCRYVYPVKRLLSLPVWRRFSLPKQQKLAHTATTI